MTKPSRWNDQNANQHKQLPKFVIVTNPIHPEYNNKVEVVRRIRFPPSLIIKGQFDIPMSIPEGDTDYATSPNSAPAAASHLLHIDGLRQAVKVINGIKQDGRFPLVEESTAVK